MKALVTPLILSMLLLGACKKYGIKGPSFGSGDSAGEVGEFTESTEETEETSEETADGEGSEETETTEEGTVEALTLWSGSSLFSAKSGDGYKIDGKALTVTPISKALVGDLVTGKAVPIGAEQITEVMDLITAAKDATTSKSLKACSASDLYGELYISLTEGGSETLIEVADTAKCEAKRYIASAGFEKVHSWFKLNFAVTTTTTTSVGTTTLH